MKVSFDIPESVRTKDDALAWCLLRLRGALAGSQSLFGDIRPLGSITVLGPSAAAKELGITAQNFNYHWKSAGARASAHSVAPAGNPPLFLSSDVQALGGLFSIRKQEEPDPGITIS